MTWSIRVRDGVSGVEFPDYGGSSDLFTIKLYHGGDLNENCTAYVGGTTDYVDKCNVEEMSYIELISMCTEVGVSGSISLFYKMPRAEMNNGLWPIEHDEDVLEMCTVMTHEGYLYVYCIAKIPRNIEVSLSQNLVLTQADLEYLEDPIGRAEFERMQEDQIYEMEGILKDFSDMEDRAEETEVGVGEAVENMKGLESVLLIDVEETEKSDKSNHSFHADSSNVDSTDDEVWNYKKQAEYAAGKVFDGGRTGTTENIDREVRDDDCLSSESSKYAGSDEERMAANSTDEDESSFTIFNEKNDMADPKFELGMMFPSCQIFKQAVRKHAIVHMRPIILKKNYGVRAKFVCDEGCNWKIYASKMQNSSTYQVTIYNGKHSCSPTFHQKQINSAWIAEYYENDIRMNPTWPLASFQQKVVNEWNCDVSIWAISRAKKKALQNINGKHAEQYASVYDYRNELLKAMPDSTIIVMTEPVEGSEHRRFLRMYICFGPLKKGFTDGCRPLLGLDGCHLKGPYGGQLLAAVGVDANDGMYPVAWAVVEAENNDSWNWFLENVKSDLSITNEGGWTFVSDRQKGLINALEAVFPSAEHRFCVMHLYRNMWKEHKGIGVRMCLWKAARATTDYMWEKHMEELKKLSRKCYNWLAEKPKSQWTRAAFRIICKSDMFVNNHCEVFNSTIRKYRDLPLISMLKAIHKSVMTRIQKRRDKMRSSYALNPICPNAMRRLNKAVQQIGGVEVLWLGGPKYMCTMSDGGFEMVVDLEQKTCVCRKWQLSGIPCYHVCACLSKFKFKYEAFIHPCYSKDHFLLCYQNIIQPISGQEAWEKTGMPKPLPPILKVQTGRPKKKRSKKSDVPISPSKLRRQHTTTRCSYCSEMKHNYAGCPARKHDEGQGIYKQVKKRVNKTKVKENITEVGSSTTSTVVSILPNPPPVTTLQRPTFSGPSQPKGKSPPQSKGNLNTYISTSNKSRIMGVGTQGGILNCGSVATRVTNTPLGVQPEAFNVPGKNFTSLRNLEKARKERLDKVAKKPVWKL